MPQVHVCPLSKVSATVAETRASHLVSLINDDTVVVRPGSIAEHNHLFLGINDIVEPADGLIAPAAEHVRALIAFVGGWKRERPIVVHCFAGISRSTVAAFITVCALKPERSEHDIAQRLRRASRFATPNARLVAFADAILGRDGRMVEAIRSIGRGEMAYEGTPFALAVES